MGADRQPNTNGETARDPRGARFRQMPLRLIVPNLITVLAICAGLTGIRLAFEHRIEMAIAMVLLAAFLDGVDGRVARALKATSNFGAQMDSLADIVNFGVAPGLVLYAFILDRIGSPGWIAALLFAIACGLRLARFNVMADDPASTGWRADYFVGVPAPAGAMLVLLPAYLSFVGVPHSLVFAWISCIFTLVVAALLVSRIPVWSGKSTGARIRSDYVVPLMLGVVLFVLLLSTYPWHTMTVSALLYLVFLPLSYRAYSRREAAESETGGP
ncbi:CDP-alcohol phosphatidyltransferase family protein [Mesorhizobium xinjiangense]|uniref:CDP-alcohol phosphatidyltransferase family protein n=1 Tax=Mesorhizobium xinjiangense TaxID=2678685 RepID=UPI0012EE3D2F|nr:phosphatidylcholine/phosphatidylserine synthase [Mesorhizobium xinjiangense]